jgi:hypothetical protein
VRPAWWSPLVGAALVGLLAGCGAAAPTAVPAAAPGPTAAPTPAGAAGAEAGAPACANAPVTISTVRGIADALERGPVLPAGVELFLTGPREAAVAPDPSGPELAAARAELVAAIDDLDAQARALLPPGGNVTRDPVQLNPARILAAAAEIERLCGSSPGRPAQG